MTDGPGNQDLTLPTKPTRRRVPILARHAVSLAVVFALAIPASYYVGQAVYRHLQVAKLKSDEQEVFDRGLGYVLTHAADDREVERSALASVDGLEPDRAANLLLTIATSFSLAERPAPPQTLKEAGLLIQKLPVEQAVALHDSLAATGSIDARALSDALLNNLNPADDKQLLYAVDLLDGRLLWSRGRVPDELWLRWLVLMAGSEAEVTQYKAADQLGALPKRVGEERITQALPQLADSKHDSVRAKVLAACAGYAKIANSPTPYEQIIFKLGSDPNPTIARRAWLIVGHLDPLSGYAVQWRDADPFVAEAMLWAAVKTNPDNPKPAMEALAELPYAPAALMALGQTEKVTWDEIAMGRAYDHVTSPAFAETDEQMLAVWRSLLALDPGPVDLEYWYVNIIEFLKPLPKVLRLGAKELYDNYRLSHYNAAVYRLNMPHVGEGMELAPLQKDTADLAAIEGRFLDPFPQAGIEYFEPESFPAALIAAAYNPELGDVIGLMEQTPSGNPVVDDLLAVAASRRDTQTINQLLRVFETRRSVIAAMSAAISGKQPKLISGVSATLLRNNPDLDTEQLHTLSDDELAGLGLSRVDAIKALLEAAESAPPSAKREDEARLLRLALWTRGDLGDDFTPTAEAMLFDKDLPTSTVLMCLLHKRRPIALQYLFGDLVTPRPDLQQLFIQHRWWHVFRRFVDTSELTLWLWGDPGAQALQIEAMRQWYAVHRWEIERGWWPTPPDSATP